MAHPGLCGQEPTRVLGSILGIQLKRITGAETLERNAGLLVTGAHSEGRAEMVLGIVSGTSEGNRDV